MVLILQYVKKTILKLSETAIWKICGMRKSNWIPFPPTFRGWKFKKKYVETIRNHYLGSLSHYLPGIFTSQVVVNGISEPSTVSSITKVHKVQEHFPSQHCWHPTVPPPDSKFYRHNKPVELWAWANPLRARMLLSGTKWGIFVNLEPPWKNNCFKMSEMGIILWYVYQIITITL